MNKLFIAGAGGHAKVCADIAKECGYTEIIFLDDAPNAHAFGKIADFEKYIDTADFFVAIGNNAVRGRIVNEMLKKGANVITLVHPHSTVSESAKLGVGCVVAAGAVINAGANVGKGVIVNTCASVDHDCNVGNYSHISVGSHVCGTVNIGKNVWIGAGATVINNIDVCNDAFVGAGAVVVKNITEKGTYIGVPAKKV